MQKALGDAEATVDLDGSIHSSASGDDLRKLAEYCGIEGEITSIHTDTVSTAAYGLRIGSKEMLKLAQNDELFEINALYCFAAADMV